MSEIPYAILEAEPSSYGRRHVIVENPSIARTGSLYEALRGAVKEGLLEHTGFSRNNFSLMFYPAVAESSTKAGAEISAMLISFINHHAGAGTIAADDLLLERIAALPDPMYLEAVQGNIAYDDLFQRRLASQYHEIRIPPGLEDAKPGKPEDDAYYRDAGTQKRSL